MNLWLFVTVLTNRLPASSSYEYIIIIIIIFIVYICTRGLSLYSLVNSLLIDGTAREKTTIEEKNAKTTTTTTTRSKIPPEHLSPGRITRRPLFCFRIVTPCSAPLICRFCRNHNDDSDRPANAVEDDTTTTTTTTTTIFLLARSETS